MPINLIVRRRDVDYIISQDPWSITVYRHGETQDDDDITYDDITGTLMPASRGTQVRVVGGGEEPVGISRVLLLIPWDDAILQEGDEVRAVQDSTDIARNFVVVKSLGQNGYKQEVLMDERE